MKIIQRYVLREHVGPFTFALSALTSLLLLNYVAKQFGNLVGKGLSAEVIGKFLLLSVPFTVAMTLPMSVLVATLYAFSRLAAENEISALKASGVSVSRLLVPVLMAAAVISVGMVAFNDRVLPAANHELRTLQGDIARVKPTFGLREQTINEVSPGQFYLRSARLEGDNLMRDVEIWDLSDANRRRSIYADSGTLAFAPNGRDLLLNLYDGYMLIVAKTEPGRLQRLEFGTDYVRVKGVANQLEVTREDSYKSDREMSVCELQNEVSRYEREYEESRKELESALLAVTREALSGNPAPPMEVTPQRVWTTLPGAPAPRSNKASLGRAYCDLMQRLRMVRPTMPGLVAVAHAADIGPRQGAPAPARPDTARPRADTGRRVVIDSTRAGVVDTSRPRLDTLAGTSATDAPAPGAPAPGAPAPGAPATPPGAQGGGISIDSALGGSSLPANPPPAVAQQTYRISPAALLTGAMETVRSRMDQANRQANQNAVELHKKFAISVACFIFVLVGAPIALRFPRGGVGLVIGVSLAVFGVYYVGLIAGESLADRDILSPFWAMWSANFLLLGIGLLLLLRMGRESATSRGGDLTELFEVLRGVFRRGRREIPPSHHRAPPRELLPAPDARPAPAALGGDGAANASTLGRTPAETSGPSEASRPAEATSRAVDRGSDGDAA